MTEVNGMSALRFFSLLVTLLFFASGSFVLKTCAQTRVDEATSALAQAEGTVLSAYEAVLEAEEAGANVSSLLVRLTEAGGFLARGHMAYSSKDFEGATHFANLSMNIGVEVQNDAVELKDGALSEKAQQTVNTIIASFVEVASIAFGGLLVWRLLRERHARYRSWLIAGSLGLMLAAAAPTSALFIRLPNSSEKFSELWLLGPGHKAEGYPFNVRVNETYSVYVGAGNHLGYSAYYRVYVKFRNQTQSLPVASHSMPSSLQELYEFDFVVRDGEVWERLLNFGILSATGFDTYVIVNRLLLNEVASQPDPPSVAAWNEEKSGYYYQLFFELWLYNMTSQRFQYHNRFVGIWLNATGWL